METKEDNVATLEEIAIKATRVLNRQMKCALEVEPDQTYTIEQCTKNALLLTQLLRELAELRSLRG